MRARDWGTRGALALLVACGSVETVAPVESGDTGAEAEPDALARVRQVAAGELSGDDASAALDQTWRELEAMDAQGVAIVRDGIREALAGERPAQPFFLVDTANYLVRHGESPRDRDLAIRALLACDATNPVVASASVDVFQLLHRLGAHRDLRVLTLVDRFILPFDRVAALPIHALFEIPAWVQAAWIYGLFGVGGEDHVRTLLADESIDRGRLYRILQWIGSEQSVAAASSAFSRAEADEATTDSYMRYLLTCGGHAGLVAAKAWLAQAEPGAVFDAVSRAVPVVEESIGQARSGQADPLSAEDARTLLERLRRARSHASVEDPLPLVSSPLPLDELRVGLIELRAAILSRLSDEALEEMTALNEVLQLAQLRDPA